MISPMDVFLAEELRAVTSPNPSEPVGQDRPVRMVPTAIPVEYWPEDDGSWSAFSPLLGVSAAADTAAELVAEMSEAVGEFWEILNENYATLSDELRGLLDLRHQALSFTLRG
jgi:predicted RNase H-like HicB family nuclease